MSEKNIRYLLAVMVIPEGNANNRKYVSTIASKLGNVLNQYRQTPNAQAIFNYCEKNNDVMEGFIEKDFLRLSIESVGFNPTKDKPNNMFNTIETSEKGKVRVMLYPENKSDVNLLKLPEATHNMIIRFDSSADQFMAVEPHVYTPSFYQPVANDIIASLYIEALLVDASMCHFIGVSSAALHHDDEQNISHEKVQFLFDFVNSNEIDNSDLDADGKALIKYVVNKLTPNTPYISFLSIFTIASIEYFKKERIEEAAFESYFSNYCKLWCRFQRWYYQKHGRILSKENCSQDVILNLFDRNKYQGQISPEAAQAEIQNKLAGKRTSSKILGSEGLYAFIILKNVPNSREHQATCKSLFSGQLHQSIWAIKPWDELVCFVPIKEFIEVVPLILDKASE